MSASALRAKLLTVRALSTILLAAALAQPAAAQFGSPPGTGGAAAWIGGEAGTLRAMTLSDGASASTWQLDKATPIRVSVDYGRFERTIGASISKATMTMVFDGTSCTKCAAQVAYSQILGRYRAVSPFLMSGLFAATELSAGVTNWGSLKGVDGAVLGTSGKTATDFTYGLSLGLVLPVGEMVELSVMYGALQMQHEQQGNSGKQNIGLNMLRFGGRVRVSR